MSTVINEVALDELLHGASGPVQRAVFLEAEQIKTHASSKVPRSDGPGPHLADSGIVEDTHIAGLPGFLIGFESDYIGPYYFGAVAHEIRARNARALAFKWPKVGPGIFHFARVAHPGNAAHPFLNETVLEMYGVHLA